MLEAEDLRRLCRRLLEAIDDLGAVAELDDEAAPEPVFGRILAPLDIDWLARVESAEFLD